MGLTDIKTTSFEIERRESELDTELAKTLYHADGLKKELDELQRSKAREAALKLIELSDKWRLDYRACPNNSCPHGYILTTFVDDVRDILGNDFCYVHFGDGVSMYLNDDDDTVTIKVRNDIEFKIIYKYNISIDIIALECSLERDHEELNEIYNILLKDKGE